MTEADAINTAQQLADESNSPYVIIKCKSGICQIMKFDYYEKSGKQRYYIKIFPKI